ncbi:MAG: hypothetical protein WBV22_02270 [Anaerolineaceae bacterium]
MTDKKQHRARFDACGTPKEGGCFEILAITAGDGNGWHFSREVLADSLPLWEGVETFIDHGETDAGRSVKDLAGVCSGPACDSLTGGIRLKLRATGPSGGLLEEIAREWLASPPPQADIGFSADLLFTAEGRQVKRILNVLSLDLVVNPARGGMILRALNQKKGVFMEPKLDQDTLHQIPDSKRVREEKTPLAMAVPSSPHNGESRGIQPLLEQENTPSLQGGEPSIHPSTRGVQGGESDELHILKLQVSAYLLESSLSSARLPAAAAEHIRRQFAGRIFDPAELNNAIDGARKLAADLVGGAVIAGAPRVEDLLSTEDRLQAAVDDLLGAPRDSGMAGKRVERLSGIRELYLTLTGDYEMRGGCDPSRVKLATTATMPNLVKNAMNKIILDQWQQLGKAGYAWWEPVVSIQHFTTLQSITGVLVGEVGQLPEVAEGAEYDELPIADSGEMGVWRKYGGYLPLTIELIDRDDLARLRSYPRKLANAALRRISSLVSSVFTDNSGTGPVMADGGALFNATPVSTPGGHANLGTAALAGTAWEAAGAALYSQPMLVAAGESGPRLALDPKYLLVPRALRLTGMRILYPSFERESNIFSENLQRGEYGDVITVPDWQDAGDWAAACDPRLAPAIIIGERFGMLPEIFIAGDPLSPAMFTNDEVRLKVRHFLSVFVADYRPLYKANVA